MRPGGRLTGLVRLAALTVAWSLANAPAAPISAAFAQQPQSGPSLVVHVVPPHATDPLIDQALDDHYAWLDTNSPTNHQLLVYLPGNDGVPASALLFQQLAARLGYHVIGLMYVDQFSLSGLCTSDPDPNACFENAHFEIVYGSDVQPGPSAVVNVNVANSIVNRLTKLLQYLDLVYPTEGWKQFLADGKPNWSQIALSGISQGAGNSAMIAKSHVVPRVVLISGVTDALPMGTLPCQGAENWLSTHVTQSDRYWGLVHDQEPGYLHICANWDSLGMSAFGPLVQVETSAPPYRGTHTLFTDLKPQRGGYKAAHPSTLIDFYTPLFPDKTPELADAWRYMITAEPDGE